MPRFSLQHGVVSQREYSLPVLRSHVRELQEAATDASDASEAFLHAFLWSDARGASVSIVAFCWWQLLVTRPGLLPASLPLALLLVLGHFYHASAATTVGTALPAYPIGSKPSVSQLLAQVRSLLASLLIPSHPFSSLLIPSDPFWSLLIPSDPF